MVVDLRRTPYARRVPRETCGPTGALPRRLRQVVELSIRRHTTCNGLRVLYRLACKRGTCARTFCPKARLERGNVAAARSDGRLLRELAEVDLGDRAAEGIATEPLEEIAKPPRG